MALTLYSTPDCGNCGFLEHLLQRRGLLYTKVDVSEDGDQSARKRLQELGFMGVPVMYDPARDEYRYGVDVEWLPPAQPMPAAG